MVSGIVFYCAVSKGQSALPTGGSKRIRAPPVAAAGGFGHRPAKIPTALIYGGRDRVLSGGSRWNPALPGRGSGGNPALPGRQQVEPGTAGG